MEKKWTKENVCGIYKITCVVTGKFYIGSSLSIRIRWTSHKNTLKRNKHANSYLQHAWNKYGSENFLFEILENVPRAKLIEREQYWLDLTKCYDKEIGFNINKNAEYNYFDSLAKTWIVTTPEGKEITVESLSDFCEENDIRYNYLQRVAKGTRPHFKGYKCRPADTPKEEWEDMVANKRTKRIYKYKVTKPDGSIIFIDNVRKFCRENNISISSTNAVLDKRQAHTQGYIIERAFEKLYIITAPDGEIIKTNSLKRF